jgi:hypothetical protein
MNTLSSVCQQPIYRYVAIEVGHQVLESTPFLVGELYGMVGMKMLHRYWSHQGMRNPLLCHLYWLEHFPITLHRILRRSDSYGIRLA